MANNDFETAAMALQAWDRLESAISDLKCMVDLVSLAREHDGPVDFAINETIDRVAVVHQLFCALHDEHHPDRLAGGDEDEPADDDETDDDSVNVVPLRRERGSTDVH
jgi:hypothetical protein